MMAVTMLIEVPVNILRIVDETADSVDMSREQYVLPLTRTSWRRADALAYRNAREMQVAA